MLRIICLQSVPPPTHIYCLTHRQGAIAAAAAGIFAAIQAGRKRRRRDVLSGFRDVARLIGSDGEDLTSRILSSGRTVVRRWVIIFWLFPFFKADL